MFRWDVTRRIQLERVVAVIRSVSARAAVATAQAVQNGGIQMVEVTMTSPDGLDAIRELAARARSQGQMGPLIGAGTVLDAETAVAAVRAGASFLVSPGLSPDVIRAGHRYGVPVFPGAALPHGRGERREPGRVAGSRCSRRGGGGRPHAG